MNKIITTMKKTLLTTFSLFAALTTVFLFSSNTAEARGYSHGKVSHVGHYAKSLIKVFSHYNGYGKAVYKYHAAPVKYSKHNTYNKKYSSYKSNKRYSNYQRSSKNYYNTKKNYSSNHRISRNSYRR